MRTIQIIIYRGFETFNGIHVIRLQCVMEREKDE